MSYYARHWLGMAALVWILWFIAAGSVMMGS